MAFVELFKILEIYIILDVVKFFSLASKILVSLLRVFRAEGINCKISHQYFIFLCKFKKIPQDEFKIFIDSQYIFELKYYCIPFLQILFSSTDF